MNLTQSNLILLTLKGLSPQLTEDMRVNMSQEKHSLQQVTIDEISFTINTVIVEVDSGYKYCLSSAMIPLGKGNGLFIRQQIPDDICDGIEIDCSEPNKYSWQYLGSGLKNLKGGYAPTIEACYQAFKSAAQELVAA